MKLNLKSRLADGMITTLAILLLTSSSTGAQQGQMFQPNSSGPAPAVQQGSDSTLELKPLSGQGLPGSGKRTARQGSSKQQTQLSGCWSAVIRQENLTSLQRTGFVRLGNWFNESYRICFAGGTATVQARELSEENIVYISSEAEVTEAGTDWAQLRSKLIWDDMDSPTNGWSLPNGKPDPHPHPLPHPYRVIELSNLDARLVGDGLRVIDRSTATANLAPAYQLTWSAEFLRD